MKIRFQRFNTYLFAVVLGGLMGCSSPAKKKDAKEDVKEDASLRLYLEVRPDGMDNSAAVLIGRGAPFLVNLEKVAFLTEHRIENASLIEGDDTFSVSVKFNDQGAMILEQYTTPNKGKRIGVGATIGAKQEIRWVAAPRITHSITNGVFVFSPAATRAEADRFVAGLNNYAEKARK